MSTTRLLLVEDDPEDVAIFRRHLPESSQLTVVTTLAAGLAAVAGGGFNVAFVDYRLGADSGLELVRATRATGNPLAIVVTTGQDIDLLGENALLAGATDFLPKADICTSAIARVTRWAMIRQFAELKRGLVISEAELREIAQ
ncbi:MAG: response regulator, partial [Gammaproteobacteria bacterium]|nr:response regulator [Gammaproteobacteria bacterium]